MSIRKQVVRALLIMIGMMTIISLSRDLQKLLAVKDRFEQEYEEVSNLEEEQQELVEELNYILSDDFVEKEARNKLLMSKPGETVVILPEHEAVESGGSMSKIEQVEEPELENWQKWVRLFL